MFDFSELESFIVTCHEKGANRGVSIYFGTNELNELKKFGIDLRNDRRLLVRTTIDNKIVLIPFSEVDLILDIKNIEDKIEKISNLEEEEKRIFKEELIAIIDANQVEISEMDSYSVLQFINENYTKHNIRNIIRIGLRANKQATQSLINSIIEKRRNNKMIDEEIVKDFSKLSKEDKDELRDELIDIVVENNAEMSQQEKNMMFQFVKGHHNINTLTNVLDIVNRTDPNAIVQLSEKYIKPGMKIAPPTKIDIDKEPENLLDRMNSLSRTIKTDLFEDLLSILSDDEIKNLNLTSKEKADIFQLIKGHYDPAKLFNAAQVAIRVLESKKLDKAALLPRKIDRELKFGVELVPATGLDKLVNFSQRFELGGIDNIWITDHYTNMDPYVTLTLIAKATNSTQLGVGVTNPYIRHLASTASTIASLDSVSDNRMILGIGAGDKSTLSALNIESQGALTTVHETVEATRLLWNNDNVNYDGNFVKLKDARLNFKPNRNIPIYIGAQGPKMLELAGEIGDGVLINASHEIDFKIAKDRILEGANKANKSIKDLDVVAYTCFSIGETKEEAMKATAPVVAFIVAATPPNVLERHDLNVETASQMRDFLSKGKMGKAFQLVNDSFIDAFSVSGNPQQCINKIENLKQAGVTQFVFGSPLGPKKSQAVDLINNSILKSY